MHTHVARIVPIAKISLFGTLAVRIRYINYSMKTYFRGDMPIASRNIVNIAKRMKAPARATRLQLINCHRPATAMVRAITFVMMVVAQIGIVGIGTITSTPPAQAATSQATWSTQDSYLTPATSLQSVACAGSSTCFAVGSNAVGGPVLYTTTGGSSGWTDDSGELPSGTSPLTGISCVSTTSCEAVGYNISTSAVVALSYNGSIWSQQSLPSGTPQLNAISCASASFCEAVGYSNSTSEDAALIFNGSTWSAQTLPSGISQLNAISCASASFCEAVGANTALTFNGLAWVVQTLPSGVNDLYGVSCPSVNSCEAVGWNTGSAVALSFNGTSWAYQSVPSGVEQFTAVSCISASSCWAAGYNGNPSSSSLTVVLSFNGSTWLNQNIPSGIEEFNAISCASASLCEAVGTASSGSAPTAISFNGSTWSALTLPSGTPPLTGISCVSSTFCLAVGYAGSANTPAAALLWNGTSWSSQALPAGVGGLTGISCASSSFCEAVGFGAATSAGVALSFDGSSWSQQSFPSGVGGLNAVSCPSVGSCIAVGYDTAIYFNGSSWSIQSLPSDAGQLTGISCTSQNFCEAVGLTAAASSAIALLFDGSTWSQQSLPSGVGTLDGVSCASATSCEAVGLSATGASVTTSGVALSYDGSIWSSQTVPSALNILGAVSCVEASASDCEAAGYSPSQVVIIAQGSAPIITSLSPASGPVAGGAEVTIIGTGFSTVPGTTTVTFGSTPALNVSCLTSTLCTVTSPPGSSSGGTVPVTIITPDGVSNAASYNYTTITGTTWTVSASYPVDSSGVSTVSLNGISCVSPKFCMAVGNDFAAGGMGEGIGEIWNGSIWASTPPAPGAVSNSGVYMGAWQIDSVSCVSASFCMAVGNRVTFGGYETTGILLWNGSTWTQQFLSNSSMIPDYVSCVSVSFCMAVGSIGDGYSSINAAESWNGTSWEALSVPSPAVAENGGGSVTYDYLDTVSCSSVSFCEAAGGGINDSVMWNGTSWALQPIPNFSSTFDYVNDLSCVSGFCEALISTTCELSCPALPLFIYSNGSWSADDAANINSIFPGGAASISCIAVQLCEVVGYSSNYSGKAALLKGSTWSKQTTPIADLTWSNDYINWGTDDSSSLSCTSGGLCMATGWDMAGSYVLSLDIPIEPSATPQISSISPSSGSVAGGNTVTIKGSNFSTVTDGTTVDFGPGNPSPKVLCTSTTTCTVTAPMALPSETSGGSVEVTLTTGKGTSNSEPYLYNIPVTVSLSAVPWSSSNTVSFTAMVETTAITVMTNIGAKCPNFPPQPPDPNAPVNIPPISGCQTYKTAQPVTSGTVTISASPGGPFCTVALPSGAEGNEITCAQTFSSDAGGVIVTASYSPPSSGSPVFGASTSSALFLQFGACAPNCSFDGSAAIPTAIINVGASSLPYAPGYTSFSATVVNGECNGGNSITAPVTKGGSCYQPDIAAGTFSFLADNGSGTYTPIQGCAELPVTGAGPVTCAVMLAAGTYQVVGKYLGYSSGSTIYAPSESKPPISVVVGGQETDVPTEVDAFGMGQASSNPSAVTFDATVAAAPSAGGQIITVGTVKFVAGTQVLCGPVAYSSSAGDFNCTSNPPAGSYEVVAEYSGATTGTATYYPSTSTAESLTMAGVASNVATSVANFGMGQASSGIGTTFSADVIPQNATNTGGQAIPGGTVTFEIPSTGQILCGPVDISGGQASCTSDPPPGIYIVVASYSGYQSGGVTYQPSESNGLTLQVNS